MANLANAGFRQLSGLGFDLPGSGSSGWPSGDWPTDDGGGSSSGGGGGASGILRDIIGGVVEVTRGVTGNYPPQTTPITPYPAGLDVQRDAAGNPIAPRAVGNLAEDLSRTIQNNLGLIVVGGIFLFAWKREPASRRNPARRHARNAGAKTYPRTIDVRPLSVK